MSFFNYLTFGPAGLLLDSDSSRTSNQFNENLYSNKTREVSDHEVKQLVDQVTKKTLQKLVDEISVRDVIENYILDDNILTAIKERIIDISDLARTKLELKNDFLDKFIDHCCEYVESLTNEDKFKLYGITDDEIKEFKSYLYEEIKDHITDKYNYDIIRNQASQAINEKINSNRRALHDELNKSINKSLLTYIILTKCLEANSLKLFIFDKLITFD